MTTEREELELAALAAGLLPIPDNKALDYSVDGGLAFCGGGEYTVWSPRHDDGDSFRLMVKLGMDVFSGNNKVTAWAFGSNGGFTRSFLGVEDKAAATREAIYQVAVEVGRRMKEQMK